jgi:hypothetical protein
MNYTYRQLNWSQPSRLIYPSCLVMIFGHSLTTDKGTAKQRAEPMQGVEEKLHPTRLDDRHKNSKATSKHEFVYLRHPDGSKDLEYSDPLS